MSTILCINSGSSSVKFSIYSPTSSGESRAIRGEVERIGLPGGVLILDDGRRHESIGEFSDHHRALEAVFARLSRAGYDKFDAVGHRVASGGPKYRQPIRIDADFVTDLHALIRSAPLHLPVEIACIEASVRLFPSIPQVACFDTAFHRTIPEVASRLPLPRNLWHEGVKKYGFHGLSYEYIVEDLQGASGRTVIAHLGNGASMVAVRDGISIDTTMSFTPTAGLIMGTRCGDLDPGVVMYLMNEKRYDEAQLEKLLDHLSGLLGISGISSDMQTLLDQRDAEPHAALAIEMFCYSARKHLAAMVAALGGIDTLVFTGGIGENAPAIRSEICSQLRYLGIEIDKDANDRGDRVIGLPGRSVRVMVIPTDEDRMIARHTRRLLFSPGL